jgi:hypothetical protein
MQDQGPAVAQAMQGTTSSLKILSEYLANSIVQHFELGGDKKTKGAALVF